MSRNAAIIGLTLLCLTALVSAQPVIGAGGILNGASFRLAAAPGGGVAPGSIISIFGTGLATSTASATSVPLTTTLNGTSVTIGGRAAPLFFVSAGQINAQVPWIVTAGSQPVVVTVNGTASAAVNVVVQATSPGIFSQASSGQGPGAIQNFVTQTNTPLNNASTAIAPGGTIIIYATGLGFVSGIADGAAGSGQTVAGVTVRIGSQTVTPAFAGLAPGFVALNQVNAVVPANTPQGCSIAVQLLVGGQVSNTTTISVASGGNCTTLSSEFAPAPNSSAGSITLSRTSISALGFTLPGSASVSASFNRYGAVAVGQTLAPPPGGGCIVTFAQGSTPALPNFSAGATALDAGALTYTPPGGGGQSMPQTAVGTYSLGLGSSIGTGTHTVAGAGGRDIGTFTATNTVAGQFNGTTDISGGTISQAAGFTASWSACPDPNGSVVVGGFSADSATNIYGIFFCSAACSARSFRVGSDVLSQLPRSNPQNAAVLLIFTGTPTRFSATGLNLGAFIFNDTTIFGGLTLGQ